MDRIRSALFVDFDNIFIGLQKIDAEAAERFATNPGQWLGWIEQGMVKEVDSDEPGDERSVLVRRCYMNPKRFHPYRPYFTRAAFHVIDTPTLTTHGKTAADIHMVMDILDTLRHETRFDEFIILSGDADFTPVLLRLRAHDRRTAAAILGPAAEAYRSAADVVIDEDTFIEAALGISSDLR
ncbi:MAG: NYN domain-containing protein, partial [Anaerolineae bacterium]